MTFDPYGDRTTPPYELVNVRVNGDNSEKFVETVGVLKGNDNVTINLEDIIWPGNKTEAPTGVFISNHLRVSKIDVSPKVTFWRLKISKK